jgi:2-oxoisovalerate dehydrogenase E1 component alpha subunit
MERPQHLRLHIPEPRHRPGEPADFSDLRLPKAGSVERPPIDRSAFAMRDLA